MPFFHPLRTMNVTRDRIIVAVLRRIRVVDIELSRPIGPVEGLCGYGALQGLVRLHGTPIGYITLPVLGDRCAGTDLRDAALRRHGAAIVRHLLSDLLAAPPPRGGWRIDDLRTVSHASYGGPLPPVTVAVCTRDRPIDLARCLDALTRLEYPALDLLVVDNAPSSAASEHLIRTAFPRVRYVREPRPGLNWARNRAILEARGEIIAYTDDDAVVDAGWVKALAEIFAENSDVMAVTGLVVPYELETEAQVLFERYAGFGCGFERIWCRVDRAGGERLGERAYTGRLGTGANMAYRRKIFEEVGLFDPALDVGTATNGGGDLDMFFRVLKHGHTLVYDPSAVVHHRHRREYAQLRTQIRNDGCAFAAYLLRSALHYPDERTAFCRLLASWLRDWIVRRSLASFMRPPRFPRELILDELQGALVAVPRYRRARRDAASIADRWGGISVVPHPWHPCRAGALQRDIDAVRTIDLGRPLQMLTDIADHARVHVLATRDGQLLGQADVANLGQPIGITRMRQIIVGAVDVRLLEPDHRRSLSAVRGDALAVLRQHESIAANGAAARSTRLTAGTSVSIVVATLDRPDDLRESLRCLVAQDSSRQIEIIVVDNNPSSGLTSLVVSEFPGVALVFEPRRGLAYARNTGIAASRGDLVVATDDDVRMPSDWLEKLIAPFSRPDVMVVTGNVLPLTQETEAERLFELYGGLGRGLEAREADWDWFASFGSCAVPTWQLGATANAAFRAAIFGHPRIGLMDEALGPGMPSGVGEDTYLFYKVLKAGFTIVYEPAAYVWHRHRRDLPALRRQIYDYSKGHVAYHLTTLIRDGDRRAWLELALRLPRWHGLRIARWLRGDRRYPLSLTLVEIAGNIMGPWALWRSRRRVTREGRSATKSGDNAAEETWPSSLSFQWSRSS